MTQPQILDLLVDGKLDRAKQKSTNPALLKRIDTVIQTAQHVEIRRHVVADTPPPAARYGTKRDAGPFAGGGLMLGSNEDVWKQAIDQVVHGLRCVALIPGTPTGWVAKFHDAGVKVLSWQPPEHADQLALVPGWDGYIGQAENQAQFDQAVVNIGKVRAFSPDAPCGIVANDWRYGHYPPNTVALVELYANEPGVGVDFGVFMHYMEQGVAAVVIVPGVYSAGVPDQQAADVYASLPADLPGVMGYAGESLIAAPSLEALRKLWSR